MTKLETMEVRECKKPGCVMSAQGVVMRVPDGWKLLPPGDAAVTRRVKASGPHWLVMKRVKNKWMSLGVYADADVIDQIRTEVRDEKASPEYQRKLEAGRARREKEQEQYEASFKRALRDFLRFDPKYQQQETAMVDRITAHAIPVGSGTVARTQRISLERKVEAATIAWMRHQTTAYDDLYIPRVAGKRREVRRDLAKVSHALLGRYRRGEMVDIGKCPLHRALKS